MPITRADTQTRRAVTAARWSRKSSSELFGTPWRLSSFAEHLKFYQDDDAQGCSSFAE
jgi:hypothetical protein